MNALDRPTLEELRERLQALAEDLDTRVVVLTGSGEKAFVAGADIKYMSALDVDEAKTWGALGHTCAQLLETMPKPTIAAINGFALGGGCELALACDMIVASETAEFGQPEILLGIIPGGGGTQRLTRVIGKQRAMELVLTGRRIGAEEARSYGLVNSVAGKKDWLEAALELADVVARRPPLAVRFGKQAVLAADATPLSAGMSQERRLYELAMATEDRVEGMNAFIEKRKPEFRGR